jgi:uncharacterized membrane protein YoaK (UPF0700 family)
MRWGSLKPLKSPAPPDPVTKGEDKPSVAATARARRPLRRFLVPLLLTFNAGYVDAAGFLTLGVFSTHVTGNIVTLLAAFVYGGSGTIAKLLAFPVFCIVIVLVRFVEYPLHRIGAPAFRIMLALMLLLLIAAAVLAMHFGPFPDPDQRIALITAITVVAAMAIQNAAYRSHLPRYPSSTARTGTSTQVMLDAADLLRFGAAPAHRAALRFRFSRMAASIATFATGCGAAALCFALRGMAVFILPAVLAALITMLGNQPVADSEAE